MATAFSSSAANPSSKLLVDDRPAYQGYLALYAGFIALPIIAGADKFLHLLAHWDQYLAPAIPRVLHISANHFMFAVGGIEMIAGLLVAFRPTIGAYVVMLWLYGIIANLIVTGFYDIALRDLGLSLAALALARMSREFSVARR